MKDSRTNAFYSSRNIPMERKVVINCYYEILEQSHFPSKNIQQLINTIVREELEQEIDDDIELHDIIVKEIIDKWEQWQNEEFESTIQWMMETENEQQVFCPVCEHNLLSLQENIISCLCGLR